MVVVISLLSIRADCSESLSTNVLTLSKYGSSFLSMICAICSGIRIRVRDPRFLQLSVSILSATKSNEFLRNILSLQIWYIPCDRNRGAEYSRFIGKAELPVWNEEMKKSPGIETPGDAFFDYFRILLILSDHSCRDCNSPDNRID